MKKVVWILALALVSAVYAVSGVGHYKTMNRDGFAGVHKTQSAQSLGHTKLVWALMGDATFGNDMFPSDDWGVGLTEYPLYWGYGNEKEAPVQNFVGMSEYMAFSIGILQYFDFGFTLPVYYDQFTAEDIEGHGPISNSKSGYIGNMMVNFKARFPMPENQMFDVAVFGGAAVGTANEEKQGLWIREPDYINKNTGEALPFGTKNTSIKSGLAVTMDMFRMGGGVIVPVVAHLNAGYRYNLNSDFSSISFTSIAAEVFATDAISAFIEYYWDIAADGWNGQDLDMKQLTGALVFHLPMRMDFHLGASYYLGDASKYLSGVYRSDNLDNRELRYYQTRVNPQYTIYFGLTWNVYLQNPQQ